jgi:hypothetical protein
MTSSDIAASLSGASERPRVVTLCGSTRFPDAFHLANAHLSMQGDVVIGLGLYGHADQPTGAKFLTSDGNESTPEKAALDQLHFRKIDLADAIFVVNVGGYIGSSTKREIAYAEAAGKSVEYMFDRAAVAPRVEPAVVDGVLDALRRPGCMIFLDGRNEHGTHILPSLPTNMPAAADKDLEEQAEEVFVAAEALGFHATDHVWAFWRWNEPQYGDFGRIELAGYWEFDGISVEMTRALAGGRDAE